MLGEMEDDRDSVSLMRVIDLPSSLINDFIQKANKKKIE